VETIKLGKREGEGGVTVTGDYSHIVKIGCNIMYVI
jgi:hypothetical protein